MHKKVIAYDLLLNTKTLFISLKKVSIFPKVKNFGH